MASWVGTIVDVIGFRNFRTGGGVTSIRPSRVPWGATLASTCTTPSYQRSSLICFPDSPRVSLRRTFWSWRGGDDKKWIYDLRGGDNRARGKTSLEGQDSKESVAKALPSFPYPVSVCSIQGFRSYMEDEHYVSLDGDFAAVFDGHGGPAVSRYLRKNLYANVQAVLPILTPLTTSVSSSSFQEDELWTTTGSAAEFNMKKQTRTASELHKEAPPTNPTWMDYQTALEAALEKVDREVQRISHWSYQGSTAVVIWIHEDKRPSTPLEELGDSESVSGASSSDNASNEPTQVSSQRTIIAANVGDSRAVLCRNSTAWELTRDHKPNDPTEKSRIEKLGGKIVWCGDVDREGDPILERGIYRVNGNLALSRAIGDRSERPHVTAEPEIIAIPVQDDEDEFIILATDGLWDVLESNEAVDLVQRLVQEGLPRDQVATWLVEESMRRGTYDNVTVVIIWLDRLSASKPS